MKTVFSFVALFISAGFVSQSVTAGERVDFNRDIRPLISDRCLACHGPDDAARQAELRLDDPARMDGSEQAVVVPGKPAGSPLFERISSTDPDLRMPPADSGKILSESEIRLIERWIAEGAEWDDHWAWVTPSRPDVPGAAEGMSPIDALIRRRLQERGLTPSAEADRVTLIRRLYFDLIGLPPTWEQVEEFLNDGSPDAYETAVTRLLQSPHYGERMAVYWLDIVRYADSNGYHSDEPRQSAPYRDYVIEAFNTNKPYDQFIIEQLAGDLLPDATVEQHVASGFNMLLQTTSEGGAQPKEYIAKYAADRVRNTSQIFLGSTMGCAECHNHKFDPFTAADFYRFAAFFADIEQPAVGNPPTHPVIRPDDQNRLDEFDQQIRDLQSQLAAATSPELTAAFLEWQQTALQQLQAKPELSPWQRIGPFTAADFDQAYATDYVDPASVDPEAVINGKSWETADKLEDGKVHQFPPVDSSAVYLYRTITVAKPVQLALSLGSDDGIRVWHNGDLIHENRTHRGVAPDQDHVTVHLTEGFNALLMKITNGGGGFGFYFRPVLADLPQDVADALNTPAAERTAEHNARLDQHFRSTTPLLKPHRDRIAAAEASRKSFFDGLPRTLMTRTSTPKMVRLLNRGNWMDESGPVMEPGIPAFMGTLEASGSRLNRLDLARWIADPSNPLTARVMVNRLWKIFFGKGLATPLDDFGRQGSLPTHPELLDWLACEFVDSGYDVKALVRQLVLSRTYRQSAIPTADQLQQDPANRFYARQTRFRLDAEFVRDNALAISGLLAEEIGGRSVYPYQPAGYWSHMNFPVREWPGDAGSHLYRRGVYTWWQRMFLHPSLKAFDAPSREECTVERPRSNIPQQALVLLNDPTYVEAANAFAGRILSEAPDNDADRLNFAFRTAVSRNITDRERVVLTNVLEAERLRLESVPTDDTAVGPPDAENTERQAWTSVARVILNLSETITRP